MKLPSRIFPAALRGRFTRNVSILMIGTLAAHALTAGSMPITSRLYTPDEFSILALYASILSILLSASTLSVHIGIPIANTDRQATSLLALSAIVLCTFTATTSLVFLFGHELVIDLLGRPDFAPYLWLLVPGVVMGGGYMAAQLWSSRQHEFSLIAQTRITRSVAGSGTQLAMGVSGAGPLGLVLGHILYSGLGVLLLLRNFWKTHGKLAATLRPRDIAAAISTNRRYMYFTTPENLANVAAIHLPVLAIAAVPAAGEIGHLFMAQMILTLPMMLMGASVGQVFLAEAPAKFEEGKLFPFFMSVLRGLLVTGAPVLIVFGVLAPLLATTVLGAEWQETGNLIAWMTPWAILQFLTSPLSTLLYVVGRQGLALSLQITSLAMRYGAVLLALVYAPEHSMQAYAVSGAIVYLLVLIVLFIVAKHSNEHAQN